MVLRSFTRTAAPAALLTLLSFGCATVRAPASAMDGEVTVGGGAEPEVELWLESGGPVSEAEKAEAVGQVRRALDRATATLVSDDGEELLVVRAQGISRTGSRKANQQAAKVGIAIGAVAAVALVVVALVAGKGGSGGGGKIAGAVVKAAPVVPRVAVIPAPPRFRFLAAAVRPAVHGVAVIGVPLPSGSAGARSARPAELQAEGPAAQAAPPEEGRTAFPPAEPITLHLPPPRPLDVEHRKFFDKDFTRLELIVVDRASGRPTWVKTVEGKVDPRDAEAVKGLLAAAIQDPAGWEPATPP